ncbi:MAG: cytochrome c553/mono/diheme cytochrome c family protein, partial [Pirellulaceae bacterium]
GRRTTSEGSHITPKFPVWKTLALTLASLFALGNIQCLCADETESAGNEFFEKQIRPLLVQHCFKCHGDKKQEGELQLSSREMLLKGGETGPAIVPSKPDDSLLIRAVEHLGQRKMPPKQKLTEADIARLKKWVAMGAPWPATSPPLTAGAASIEFKVTPTQRDWWSFQPVKDSTPPAAKIGEWSLGEWSLGAIDQFILAQLTAHKLTPSPAADRRRWLRRATFDLTGLPPAPEELNAFVADNSDGAFERVVDRLLESPAYGQRWARHWLDVVRYADYHDADAKARNPVCEPLEAWMYRDWVVESLNRDLPFDQFITHQIAGDLLPAPDGKQPYADGLIATTFLVNGAWDRGDADKEKMVSDMVDDQIDTIGKAFLGLTLGCARCHNHKFDPVSQADYYALAGIFYSTRMLKELGTKGGEITLQRRQLVSPEVIEKRNQQVKQIGEFNAKLAELDKATPKPPADDPARVALVAERDRVQQELLSEPTSALAVSEGGVPGGLFPGIQDVPIHIRGSYTKLGPVVSRRMPTFLAGESQPKIATGSGRRELAAWVSSRENPMTARVIVNRVWKWHFGEGLVRTPNNFGLLSEPPSHPQLLDWLAARFVEDGWSLKKLHRRIMLSATYGQSSHTSRQQYDQDPDNRWLGRFAPRRLEAEAIRDAMLFVSGRLDPKAGGPAQGDVAVPRRSLYIQTARWDRGNYSILFDAANPDASVEARTVSTVATQALFLLNNHFVIDQAQHLGQRIIGEVKNDVPDADTARIERAYQLLFSRPPTAEELKIAIQIVAHHDPSQTNANWADLAHVLLCSNEFVYID